MNFFRDVLPIGLNYKSVKLNGKGPKSIAYD